MDPFCMQPAMFQLREEEEISLQVMYNNYLFYTVLL